MTEGAGKIYTDEELNEMFNTAFLPILQEISKRQKEREKNGDEFIAFKVDLSFLFPHQDATIQFEELASVTFQLTPQIAGPIPENDETNS